MNNLNTVLPNGTFGMAVSLINDNFSLIVNAINSLEYASTKSKGIHNYGFVPNTTTIPNAVSGDWCMVLREGNTFPADIWTYNGTSWTKGGTWTPEGIDLTDYATKTELNTAVANSVLQATALVGYYQCTVSGTTLAVTAPGFTLPAHGGNIRIKMSAPATGASTLNINGTGAKTLLYNGLAVSSANTWEQDEIITVFYDPSGSGQYLASNSQGGGVKAEKIKYDNSQSGLSAENVQGALDEVADNIDYKIELVSHIEQANGYINNGLWKTSTSYYGGWVNVQAYRGKNIKITAGSIRTTGISFFTQKMTTNNRDLTNFYANGWSGQVAIQPNESGVFVVPDNAQYLYVLLKGTDSRNATPASAEIIYDNSSNNADYLRAPINIELSSDDFEQGAINAYGVEADNTTRIRSRFIYVGGNYTECNMTGSGFKYAVFLYDKNKNYIGCLFWWDTYKFMDAYYIKFVVGYTNDSVISMADIPLITITSGASVLEPKEDVAESDVAFLKYQNYNHNGGTLNFTADDFETGGIAISGINDGVSNTRARSKHYIDVYDCDADVYLNDTSYSMYVFVYDENKTLLTTSGAWVNNYKATGGRYVRIAIRKGNGSVSFSPADINWTDCYIKLYPSGSISISSGIIYPYMEVFKSIPSTEINEEFQSFCKVGNEFWIASGGSGDDAGSTVDGYIYRYDSEWNYIGKMRQTVAHWNSMSYDPSTDRLITGQMGNTSNRIYIFGNVSQWPTIHASTAITSSDIERTIIISQVSNRPNPVWAERNALGHRDIIISGNLNSVFLKIRLGYGTNQLSNGTYTASADGVPNGTYDIIWNIPFTPPAEIYAIAAKIPQYPTAVCQGIDYYKGKIYAMSTVTPSTIIELTPNGNMMDYRIIHQLWSDDSGNAVSNCANEGIMCLDGKIYVGVSAIGTTTTITQYNNKILRFDL